MVQGAQKLSDGVRGPNGDVWVLLDQELRRRPHLQPSNVKAHSTLSCVSAGILTFHQYTSNGLADAAASAAAVLYEEGIPA